jgi:hypothetical protein
LGYEADQEYELMKAVLSGVECDLVVVGFYENDFTMTTRDAITYFTNKYGLRKSEILKENMENLFGNTKRNFNNIPQRVPKTFYSLLPWYKKLELYKALEKRSNINIKAKLPNESKWNYFRNEYLNMLQLTKEYNLPPLVVALLHNGNIDPRKSNFKNPVGQLAQMIELYKYVGKKLSKYGIQVVDTLPLFKKYSGKSMAVSEWEMHANYLGHYLYAQSIFDYLVRSRLIPY